MTDSTEWPTLERGSLRLGPDEDVPEQLVLEDTHVGLAVPLDADALRWLVTAAGPAALAVVPRPPLLPPRAGGTPNPDAPEENHAA